MGKQATLQFFGDISLDGIYCEPQQHAIVSQNMKYVNSYLNTSDLKIVNWESMIWGNGETNQLKNPRLCTTKEAAESVLPLRFDLALVANNHVFDNGLSGFRNTIKFFEENNIKFIGASENISELKPYFVKVNGISFVIFNFVGHETNPCLPDNCPLYLSFFDYNNPEVIYKQIAKYKPLADHIIVTLHWGENELSRYPNEKQRRLSRNLIDKGNATVVVGHHVHCLQGYEEYKNGYIAYSLGNFIFGPQLTLPGKTGNYRTEDTRKIGVLGITFSKTEILRINWNYFHKEKNNLLLVFDSSNKVRNFHLRISKPLKKKSIKNIYKIEQKLKIIRISIDQNGGLINTLVNLRLRHLKTLLK